MFQVLKDKVQGFQRNGATASVHLRRIKTKETPLDLARRITVDLSVIGVEAILQAVKQRIGEEH